MRGRTSHTANITMLAALLVFGAIAVIVAEMNEERGFDGTVVAKMGITSGGQWQKVDQITVPLHFTTTLREMGSGKQVSTSYSYVGPTELGKKVHVTMTGNGTMHADLASGKGDMNLPLHIQYDGKTLKYEVLLTTEGTQGGSGMLPGKRASIDHTTHTATLTVAGSQSIPVDQAMLAQFGKDPNFASKGINNPGAKMVIDVMAENGKITKK